MASIEESYNHNPNLYSVDYDKSNSIVWAGDSDGLIIGYNVSNDTLEFSKSLLSSYIFDLKWDSDRGLVWAVDSQGTVKGWDPYNNTVVHNYSPLNDIRSISLDNKNGIIWTGGSDGTGGNIVGYDISAKTVDYRYAVSSPTYMYAIQYDKNQNLVWFGGYNSTKLRAYDPSTDSISQSHSKHSAAVMCLSYDSSRNIMWSGDDSGSVIGWDISSQSVAYNYTEHTDQVRSIYYYNDIIYTGSSDSTVKGWDINNSSLLYSHNEHSGNNVQGVDPVSESGLIYSVDNNGNLYGVRMEAIAYQHSQHTNNVNSVDYDSTNDIIWSASDDDSVIGWDISSQSVSYSHSQHTNNVNSVDYDSENNIIWSASSDNSVIGWDISSKSIAYQHSQHSNNVNSVDYDSANDIIWSASSDNSVIGWDISSKSIAYSHSQHSNNVNSVDYDSANDIIWSASSDNSVIGWDISSQSIAYSHSQHSNNVNSVDYDSTNDIIWSSSSDNSVIGWGISSQSVSYSHSQHSNNVNSVKYDSYNNIIWSASSDNSVIGWDISSQSIAYSHSQHSNNVNSVDIDKNNHLMWSGSDDDTVIGYDFGIRFKGFEYPLKIKSDLYISKNPQQSSAFRSIANYIIARLNDETLTTDGITQGEITMDGTSVFTGDATVDAAKNSITAQFNVFPSDASDSSTFNELLLNTGDGTTIYATSFDTQNVDRRYIMTVEILSK